MKRGRIFAGSIRLELTGADIPGTLARISRQGIALEDIQSVDDLTIRITVSREDLPQLEKITEKQGDRVRFLRRSGLYWKWKAALHRPILLVGFCLLLILSLYLPSVILFVEVEGNENIPSRLIIEKAGECGIRFGASRRAVRSEKMKNALLEALPELKWAGVNTKGCVATISVREGSVLEKAPAPSAFGHIVAALDGVVTDCTATRGNLLCTPGQAVAAGDILISGYTDTGLGIIAEQAQGEIYGRTRRSVRAVALQNSVSMTPNGTVKKKISLIIGKNRINLWKDSGIWVATCDRMYEEYYVTLPGGFRLPVKLAVESFESRDFLQRRIPDETLQDLLSAFGKDYLSQQMLAGTIRDAAVTYEAAEGYLQMAGQYDCVELIGKMQRLQIGDKNG